MTFNIKVIFGGIKVKKYFAVALSVILVLLSFSSCSDKYKSNASLVYNLSGSVYSLDPQTAKTEAERTVVNAIFEGLCRLDSDGNAAEGIAKKWENNNNFTTFTFYLRNDATWSEKTPVTADDFVFGMQRSLMPETKSTMIDEMFIIKNAAEVNSGELPPESLGVTALDEHTLQIELVTGFEDFPRLTAGARFMPCNREFFESTSGHYGLECVYTQANGPFTFKTNYSWDHGEYIDLARTVNYKGPNVAKPSDIRFTLGSDSTLAVDPLTAVVNGYTDLAAIPKELEREAIDAKCTVLSSDDSVFGLLFNSSNEYLKNKGLREVFTKTINRNLIIDRFTATTRQAYSIMPRSIRWNSEPYSQELIMYPEEDQSVISNLPYIADDLGLSSDRAPSITVICPDDELSRDIANSIIVSWNNTLSNSFNIEPLSDSDYEARLASGDYEAALYTLKADGSSPLDVLQKFTSTASPKLMENEEFDNLVKSSNFNLDNYRELESYVIYEYVFYPIYYEESFYAESPIVTDIYLTPDIGFEFSKARKIS